MDNKHMQAAIKKGLLASPKYIPSWYFYDAVGSDAYKQGSKITPDYYLFKSDMAIISTYIEEMLDIVRFKCTLIDYGCGDGSKSSRFISGILKHQSNLDYIPIDISKDILASTCESFKKEHGEAINIIPQVALVSDRINIIRSLKNNKFIICLGLLQNLTYSEQVTFLLTTKEYMSEDDVILASFDITADENQIKKAYSPSLELIRKFGINALHRLNRELSGNIIVDHFDCKMDFVKDTSPDSVSYVRISAECQEKQSCLFKNLSLTINFEDKERVYVQNDIDGGTSCKYTMEQIHQMAAKSGLHIIKAWIDPEKHTTICCFKKLD